MGVTTYVHAGVVVDDLEEAVRFFTVLGLECGEPMTAGGEWVDRIIGLRGTRVELVMANAPDGTGGLEIVTFHAPRREGGDGPPPAVNVPGVRHLAYQVDDMAAVVDAVRAGGWDLVGEVVDYEGLYLLAYVRGPEGLIVELAEPLTRDGG
ncbi:MAG: VOC family protein [Thermoleophilia bacterium]